MDKRQALKKVARATAATLAASTTEEASGLLSLEGLSDADVERLEWAIEEVRHRLYRMGGSE